MKKILLTFSVIFLSKVLFAFDRFQINPFIGLNIATIQEYDKLKVGSQIGVLGRFGKNIYIGTGAIYCKQAVIMRGETFSLSGTQVPLLFGKKVFEKESTKIRVGFGPCITFVNNYEYNGLNASEGKHHYLWAAKFEANWSVSIFTFGLDYDLGITPIEGAKKSRFNKLGLNLGFNF